MFSLNEIEEGFTLPKKVTKAPYSPIFSLEEDITANGSVTEIVNEILNNSLLEDHQVVSETSEYTDSTDKSSTTSAKLKKQKTYRKKM